VVTTAAVLFAVHGASGRVRDLENHQLCPWGFPYPGRLCGVGDNPVGRAGIFLFGRDVTGQAPDFLVCDGIAYAPQEKAISQDLSVRDNLGLATASDLAFREALPRAFELFSLFERRLVQKAGTLLGGEQKMPIVARALWYARVCC